MADLKIEIEIEKKLIELLSAYPKLIVINFFDKRNRERDIRKKSEAHRECGVVIIDLIEPSYDEDLHDWDNALTQAKDMADQLVAENIHEKNHPNFFKAIRARIKPLSDAVNIISYQ